MKYMLGLIGAATLTAAAGIGAAHSPAHSAEPVDSRAPLSRWVNVQGSVTYLQRIGLPRGAKLKISVQDTSLADAPAKVIASRVYSINTVPKHFTLRIPRNAAIDENKLSLTATIKDSRGKLWFVSTTHIGITQSPFSNYVDVGEIILESAR